MTKARAALLVALVTLILVVAIIGTYGWSYYYGPCGVSVVDEAIAKMSDINSRYGDAIELANSTARMNLTGPVSDLQALKHEAETINIPECMGDYQDYIVLSMDASTRAFIRFMAQESTQAIDDDFTRATNFIEQANKELKRINQCKPNCS